MRFPKVFVNTNPRVLCQCWYRESSAAVPTYLGARYPHRHKHPRVRVQATEIELAQCPLGALRHFRPPLLPVRSALNMQGGASSERLTRMRCLLFSMQRALRIRGTICIGHGEGTLSPPFSSLLLFLPPSFPLLFRFFFFKNSNKNWSHLSKVSARESSQS